MNLRSTIFAALIAAISSTALAGSVLADTNTPDGIVYDSEFQKLWGQNGDRWLEENKEVNAKLAELEQKFGKKPNIIH